MSIKRKILYVFGVFIVLLLLFNIKSYAGTQSWNSLDYNVMLNPDGSMNIIETWNINISETNTLFKDFDIDSEKYSGITDVKVSQVKNGKEAFLEQIYNEQYHVDSGCFYALPLSSNHNKFEIAWNVGLDNSSDIRTYKLYYTIEDAVKIYKDCTELYWMFLETDNVIPGNNVTGTIKLPTTVSDIEKLRVWAHGPLEGEINRISKDTITFSLNRLKTKTMLEIRIVTEENVYKRSENFYNVNKLDSILREEKVWADEANRTRNLYKVYYLIALILLIATLIIFYNKMKKYKKEGAELVEKYKFDIPEMEYFREIPDEENATPSRVVFLRNIKRSMNNIIYDTPKIFSATILDLSVKGVVEFVPIDNKTFNIIIKNATYELPSDEKHVYNLLLNIARKTEGSPSVINSKELTRYAKRNYDEFYNIGNKINESSKQYQLTSKNVESKKILEVMEWENLFAIYIFILSFGIFLGIFSIPTISSGLLQVGLILGALGIGLLLGSIINLITVGKIRSKLSILSSKGYEEKRQWEALERYMKEYSLLKEKQVFDVVLWEKFLVYATAFGISKKVLEQLKTVHPEAFVTTDNYTTHYGYWYLISNNNFGEKAFSNLNNAFQGAFESAQSAYNIAHSNSSSGSGGGGGFSSGGGGRRWPVEAAADAKIQKVKFRDYSLKFTFNFLLLAINCFVC